MSEPQFHLDFEFSAGRLRAVLTGKKGNLATSVAYWTQIAEEARRVNPQTVLVIDNTDGDPLPADMMESFFTRILPLRQGFEHVRVAFVETTGDQVPAAEVGEIHAREQGINARVFSNEADAEVWLRHGLR